MANHFQKAKASQFVQTHEVLVVVTTSKALVSNSDALVTSSEALITSSDALVTSSFLFVLGMALIIGRLAGFVGYFVRLFPPLLSGLRIDASSCA